MQDLHQLEQDRRCPEPLRSAVACRVQGDVCIVPPNSFALARSLEYFNIPRQVLTICVGKSPYAHSGIIVKLTPLEPEWQGFVTLQIFKHHPTAGARLLPRVYFNERLCQLCSSSPTACARCRTRRRRENISLKPELC
jgi:dCTP deaminase